MKDEEKILEITTIEYNKKYMMEKVDEKYIYKNQKTAKGPQ